MSISCITADVRAARIMAAQHGVISLDQARAAGLTPDQVHHRLRTGRWRSHLPGVYEVAGTPASWRKDAAIAVLACCGDPLASHLTSLAFHSIGRPPVLPHVTVAKGASVRTRNVRVHRSTVTAADRVVVDGVPCTTVARALVESAALLDRPSFEDLVDEAFCDGKAAPESVHRALDRAGRRGRPGAGLVLATLEVWTEAIRPGSPAEVRFLRRLVEWGVDDAVTQMEVRDTAGAVVGRVDVASPSRRRIWEYDSDRFHNPRCWDRDEARTAALHRLGWRVDHVAKRDLLPSATRIRDSLAA